jgi:hypothetical protein
MKMVARPSRAVGRRGAIQNRLDSTSCKLRLQEVNYGRFFAWQLVEPVINNLQMLVSSVVGAPESFGANS